MLPPASRVRPRRGTIAENTAANTAIGDLVEATDPNGDILTYTLEGTDAASFDPSIPARVNCVPRAALNYEGK